MSVPDVGPIAPLFDGLDGSGPKGRVSLYQSHALNLAVLIDDLFQNNCSARFPGARFDRIFRRNALNEPLFRTLGREKNSAVSPGKWVRDEVAAVASFLLSLGWLRRLMGADEFD